MSHQQLKRMFVLRGHTEQDIQVKLALMICWEYRLHYVTMLNQAARKMRIKKKKEKSTQVCASQFRLDCHMKFKQYDKITSN